MPLLKRHSPHDDADRAGPDERSAVAADVELIESRGCWTLRIGCPASKLTDGSTVSVRVYPNLVPGVAFDADIVGPDAPALS